MTLLEDNLLTRSALLPEARSSAPLKVWLFAATLTSQTVDPATHLGRIFPLKTDLLSLSLEYPSDPFNREA